MDYLSMYLPDKNSELPLNNAEADLAPLQERVSWLQSILKCQKIIHIVYKYPPVDNLLEIEDQTTVQPRALASIAQENLLED
jgi:hypothetical protein